jgi:hypothetical protein
MHTIGNAIYYEVIRVHVLVNPYPDTPCSLPFTKYTHLSLTFGIPAKQ